jgi:hypothetical protein
MSHALTGQKYIIVSFLMSIQYGDLDAIVSTFLNSSDMRDISKSPDRAPFV